IFLIPLRNPISVLPLGQSLSRRSGPYPEQEKQPMIGAFRRIVGSTLPVAMVVLLSTSGKALAGGVTAEIGYDDLVARLGAANVPTGLNIVVSQVEAPESPGNYGPDQTNSEFIGKTFTAMSGSPGNSSHATFVGQNMYGTVTSIVPGITSIFLYEATS